MTWMLILEGRLLYTGSYAIALDYAEGHGLCERAWHPDGTELAPRMDRGCILVPAAMVAGRARRVA